MFFTPVRTPESHKNEACYSPTLRRAPIKNASSQNHIDISCINGNINFSSLSNPGLVSENEDLKIKYQIACEENRKQKALIELYKLQIAELEKKVLDLEVYKTLLLTRNSHTNETWIEKDEEAPIETPKHRVTASSKKEANGLIRNAIKTQSGIPADDSLFSTPIKLSTISRKRESIELQNITPFLSKRKAICFNTPDEEDVPNKSLNISILDKSDLHPSANQSSITFSSGNDLSILQSTVNTVNFDAISISNIEEESAVSSILPERVERNPADMSYEELLRWEQQQGGVLEERWKTMKEEVMNKIPCRRKEGNEGDNTCCICTCEYEDEDILRFLPCQHSFHKDCVDDWFQKQWKCPFCKYNLMEWYLRNTS